MDCCEETTWSRSKCQGMEMAISRIWRLGTLQSIYWPKSCSAEQVDSLYGPRLSNCWLPAAAWAELLAKLGHIDPTSLIPPCKFNFNWWAYKTNLKAQITNLVGSKCASRNISFTPLLLRRKDESTIRFRWIKHERRKVLSKHCIPFLFFWHEADHQLLPTTEQLWKMLNSCQQLVTALILQVR